MAPCSCSSLVFLGHSGYWPLILVTRKKLVRVWLFSSRNVLKIHALKKSSCALENHKDGETIHSSLNEKVRLYTYQLWSTYADAVVSFCRPSHHSFFLSIYQNYEYSFFHFFAADRVCSKKQSWNKESQRGSFPGLMLSTVEATYNRR